MSKVAIKKKIPSSANKIVEGLNSLYQEMFNLDDKNNYSFDCNILFSKYINYRDYFHSFVENYISIIKNIKNEAFAYNSKKIIIYLLKIKMELFNTILINNLNKFIDLNDIPMELKKELKENYLNIKNSNILNIILSIGMQIEKTKLRKSKYTEFINDCKKSIIELKILSGFNIENCDSCNYDFTSIFDDGSESNQYTEQEKLDIFNNLVNIKVISKNIYREYLKPDINPDKIFSIIQNVIDINSNKSQVNTLINKYKNLFSDNFSNYYRESVKLNSPIVFITKFLDDVKSDLLDKKNKGEKIDSSILYGLKDVIKKIKDLINNKMASSKLSKNKDISNKFKSILDLTENFIDEYDNLECKNTNLSEEKINELKEEFQKIFIPDI